MFSRILNFLKLDATLSLRDSVLVYSLLSPLVLALIVRIVVPSVQESTGAMVVGPDIPAHVVERLASFGEIERVESPEAVRERVGANDDAPGVVRDGSGYRLILEGNEAPGAAEGFRVLLVDALAGTPRPEITVSDLQGEPTPVLEYGAVMLVVLSLFVGGILVGFNVVDEKEGGVIRAMAVSPLRMLEYIAARSVLAVVIAYAAGFGSAYIVLGGAVPAGLLAISIAAALFVALPFGFIIGAFADNQMVAFALIKLLMAVFITVPFVSIFVPDRFQFLFYVFPNYWMFTAISNAIVGAGSVGYGWSLLLSAASGLVLTGLLLGRLRRGLRLR